MRQQRFTRKHGRARTSIYSVFLQMMRRCYSPQDAAYRHYGGRGITVTPEWHSFERFYRDMGDKPSGLTLERVDNDKGYSKENCIWATRKAQTNNRRSNVLLTFDGVTLNQKQWATRVGIDHRTLHLRLKAGWSVEKALTQPLRIRPRHLSGKHAVAPPV